MMLFFSLKSVIMYFNERSSSVFLASVDIKKHSTMYITIKCLNRYYLFAYHLLLLMYSATGTATCVV